MTPNDHTGVVIVNNFVAWESWVTGDVAIGVFDSPVNMPLILARGNAASRAGKGSAAAFP